jgi:hypothetical protein
MYSRIVFIGDSLGLTHDLSFNLFPVGSHVVEHFGVHSISMFIFLPLTLPLGAYK